MPDGLQTGSASSDQTEDVRQLLRPSPRFDRVAQRHRLAQDDRCGPVQDLGDGPGPGIADRMLVWLRRLEQQLRRLASRFAERVHALHDAKQSEPVIASNRSKTER